MALTLVPNSEPPPSALSIRVHSSPHQTGGRYSYPKPSSCLRQVDDLFSGPLDAPDWMPAGATQVTAWSTRGAHLLWVAVEPCHFGR